MPMKVRPLAEGESPLLPVTSEFAAPKHRVASAESLRMASLRDHAVLDTPPEKRFDRIVELAAAYFQAPIALISLVDDDRQWFKACIGLAVAETPREWAFCDHTIRLGAHSVLVVPDALNDARFANNPLVVGVPFIRFYAGAVLTTDDGHNLGTLCIIDTKSRPAPSDVDLKYLVTLASLVVDQLELSKALGVLEEQQRMLKSAESMSGVGHWRFDQGTQIVSWSDEVFKIHGIPREAAVPPYEVIQQLYHEEDRKTLSQAVSQAQETGKGYQFQLRIRRPNGEIRHTTAKAECSLDHSGKTISIFGVFQDITDQHIAAAALAASEQHYRLLADNVSDVIAVYNVDGTFRYVSPSVFHLLGFTPEELLGRTTFSLIHPDDHDRVAREFKIAARAGHGAAVEYRASTKGGDIKWLEAKPKFHYYDAGNLAEISDSVRDVTERRMREVALRQASLDAEAADKAKATFLANMSHEIRTPMNGVLGFAELLLASDLDAENRLQVQLIAESGRAMMRLLNDILDISKIESGQMQIAAEPIDLRHLLRSAVKLMEPGAIAKGVDISVRIDPSLPRYISGDQLRMRQIILNLIGNAIKFTERGWVELYAVAEEGSDGVCLLCIEVRDSGIGIEASQLDRIFKHFAQADDTIERRFGGTGLGLPISAELARLMGGGIGVASALGKGSTFTLRMPLVEVVAEDQVPALHGEAAGACTGREHRPRVLVAEDHDINQTLITAMATRVGLDPIIARDGAEAVSMVIAAAADHRPFAMVLMDIQMPKVDGLEATRQLRAAGFDAKTLPVVALTANAYAEDIAACMEAGMQAHLSKPVRLRDLKHLANLLSAPLGPEIAAVQSSIPDEGLASRFALRQKQLLHLMAEVVHDGQLTADGFEALLQMLHQFAGTAGYFGQHAQGGAAAALEKALLKAGPQCAIPLLINARKALDAAASGLG